MTSHGVEEIHNPAPEVLEQSVEEPRKAITHTTAMKHVGELVQYAMCSNGNDSDEL